MIVEPINISRTKKILDQMINCVCKIKTNDGGEGTGFFCKYNEMNYLMTCDFIINEKYLRENKELNLSLNNEKELIKIDLGIKRVIYCKIEYNSTFIELKEEDKIKNYLELDDNLFNDNEKEYYENKSIYVLHYFKGEEIYASYGLLRNINKYEILHQCFTDNGSSGSPILNLTSNKVIGIHCGGFIKNVYKKGIFLKNPLNDFMNKRFKMFKIIKELGYGGFGKVNLIFNISDNKYYAMKEISLKGETIENINNIKIEANILSKFKSENIVKYYDSFIDKEKFYILMEYCDGKNLKDFLDEYKNKNTLIEEDIIYNIIKQICLGIKKIHDMKIIHRDLKPENIFMNYNMKIKIGDFGLSKQLNSYTTQITNKKAGSIYYMAPEILDKGLYNSKSDMLSLGCIIYELLTLNIYFTDKFNSGIKKIDANLYNNKWQKLINLLLQIDYDKRPDINKVFNILEEKKEINSEYEKPKRNSSVNNLRNHFEPAMNKQMPPNTPKEKGFKNFQKNDAQNIKFSASVFLKVVKVIPNKSKRYENDKKIKFNLDKVNKDYFIKLKDQCKNLFTEAFIKKIFSENLIKQVESFKDMKEEIDKKINIPIYFDNLDLLLKIISIIIINNLTSTLIKNFLEFLDSLYKVIYENKYEINEIESNIIINLLIDKLSLNNNSLKEHLFSLLNKYIEYMDTNKIMVTVINIALNKNNKIKADILNLIIDLVNQKKLNISTKIYVKLLCKFLPFYENGIRNRTLPLFLEIYKNLGNEFWSMIEISYGDKKFLEENLCADDDEEEEYEEREVKEDDEEGKDEKVNGFDKNETLTKEGLYTILDNLLLDGPNEKLNTIILIHEIICEKFDKNKEVLIPNVDKIIATFKTDSQKLFYIKDINNIPIKYAKYVSIIFCKLASNKELISHLSYNVLVDTSRELLKYLLINGLDKIGDQKEGEIIFKSINSTMLRILENCDITHVIMALLELIKEFHEKDDKSLVVLAIKCLDKTKNDVSKNIDSIDMSKILLQIHLLLLSLQKNNKDLNGKKGTDAIIINVVKNIIGEFAKLKKEKMLEEYSKLGKNHQLEDKFLLKWIKASLEKLNN